MDYRISVQCLVVLMLIGFPLHARRSEARQAEEAAQAESMNEEARASYSNGEYRQAVAQFRQAIAHSPDARYYFNLCSALVRVGELEDALEACSEVENHDPSSDVQLRADRKLREILAMRKSLKSAAQSKESPAPAMVVEERKAPAEVPSPSPHAAVPLAPPHAEVAARALPKTPSNARSYALGASLLAAKNLGLGERFSRTGAYGAELQVESSGKSLGGRGYLGFYIDDGAQLAERNWASIYAGAALFMRQSLGAGVSLVPLVGIQLAAVGPTDRRMEDGLERANEGGFLMLGMRGDVGLEWAWSRTDALSLGIAFDYYVGARQDSSEGVQPGVLGLDNNGATAMLRVGFTRRVSGER